jgi:hypothetical protein
MIVSASIVSCCVWALLASVTALLPLRVQYAPAIMLAIVVPFLLIFVGFEHGLGAVALGLTAFISLFRVPLLYVARQMIGAPVRS